MSTFLSKEIQSQFITLIQIQIKEIQYFWVLVRILETIKKIWESSFFSANILIEKEYLIFVLCIRST
jgi:hypothetical protein